MASRVLVAGVSTRAVAESAAKAGFAVTAIDAFGDLDQHPSVRSLPLSREPHGPFTAHAAADAVRDIEADAVAYLSPFENHARAVEALASGRSTSLGAGRMLWGNAPDVLRRVRDPFFVTGLLRRRGLATPMTRVDVPSELTAREWLVKPFRSGGGQGVRPWAPGTQVPPGCYAQERVDGIPASIVFVAAGGRVVPLGVTRQLIGDAAFGASGYRYCGNLLAHAGDDTLTETVVASAIALAECATQEFGLLGLNGIDFIVRDGVPVAIEINPRWCASMELVERHHGVSMFGVHAAACAAGELPSFDLARARQARSVIGKAIVFARDDITLGDTRPWLADGTIRDVPSPGDHIAAGQPVCTVFAEAAEVNECLTRLRARAHSLLNLNL
jgi:predicted ATP-grasp superfamily ATP-dependent carboligase